MLHPERDPRDLVPALLFHDEDGRVLVDVELRGEFPANFRLDVTEPPPAEALFPLAQDPSVRFSLGKIVVVDRDHPLRVPFLASELVDYEGNDDGTRYTQSLRTCAPDGRCLSRRLSCHEEACELRVRTPGFEPDFSSGSRQVHSTALGCDIGYCTASHTYCTNDSECESEYRYCDTAGLGRHDTAASSGTITRCEVLSEDGDLSVERYEQLEEVALNYLVLYLSGPGEFPPFGKLGRGYHLVKFRGHGPDAMLASMQCAAEARIQAVRDYNQEHGTDHVLHEIDDPEANAVIQQASAELEAQCPQWVELDVIEDPLAESLTFTLGREFSSEG